MRIAWDLAHDWLGGPPSGRRDWRAIPDTDFLGAVGYVRLHDADQSGVDHLPLVVGNVPYTTQLRSLSSTTFNGPVCVALRYTGRAAQFGRRAALEDQSLAVTRRIFRLSINED